MTKTKTEILESINALWRDVRDNLYEPEEPDNDDLLAQVSDLVSDAEEANSLAEEAEDFVNQTRKATERVLNQAEELRDAAQS